MDYKEKLRLAKEALDSGSYDKDTIEYIFPELKESGDEKVREALIELVKCNERSGYFVLNNVSTGSMIAWLEKQGKQKDFTSQEVIPRYSIGDVLCDKLCTTLNKDAQPNFEIVDIRNGLYICDKGSFPISQQDEYELVAKKIQQKSFNYENANIQQKDFAPKVEHLIPQKGMYYTCIKDYYASDNTHLYVKGNVYKSPFNGYIEDEAHLGSSWTNSCAEKYFEQTKNDDWIVCEHNNVIGKPMQYKEFKKKEMQRFIENLKAQGLTPKLRLWTIQDAKDGDVLISQHNKPFIYNGNYDSIFIGSYCGISVENRFRVSIEKFHWTGNENIYPATKEQRDTLMKEMTDAGYTFDFDKKELKKVEK